MGMRGKPPSASGGERVACRVGQHLGRLYAYALHLAGVSSSLIAPRMHASRPAAIARVVHRLTRARLSLDPAGVLALDEARSDAEPCLA
jgi:hypothetical protein